MHFAESRHGLLLGPFPNAETSSSCSQRQMLVMHLLITASQLLGWLLSDMDQGPWLNMLIDAGAPVMTFSDRKCGQGRRRHKQGARQAGEWRLANVSLVRHDIRKCTWNAW